MDRATIITVGTAIGTVLAALAMHGKAALEAVAGFPGLIQAFAAGLPFGLWSFLMALVLAVLVWAVAIRKLQCPTSPRAPHVSANTLAWAVALLVCMAQQWTQGESKPGAVLNAGLIGTIAGLLAPYIGSALRATFTRRPPA